MQVHGQLLTEMPGHRGNGWVSRPGARPRPAAELPPGEAKTAGREQDDRPARAGTLLTMEEPVGNGG
ncbi:MAG: hypothetical protein EA388_03075 [Nitriliruptor sp.]|nr:MAG: hypothetical protein EA388_03075 [Nitriliruptor sp.]